MASFIQCHHKQTKQMKLMFYDLTSYVNEKNTNEFLLDMEIKLSNAKVRRERSPTVTIL